MAKLNAVNVIEWFNETIQAVHSFTDDKEGNQQAEELFAKIAKENGMTDGDIEFGLEEGCLDHSNGDWQLFITHSI